MNLILFTSLLFLVCHRNLSEIDLVSAAESSNEEIDCDFWQFNVIKIPSLVRQDSPESMRLLNELISKGKESERERRVSALDNKRDLKFKPSVCVFDPENIWRNYELNTNPINFNSEEFTQLIDSSILDPNQTILGNRTTLIMAILKGDLDLVNKLLEVPGIDVNYKGNSEFLPIELAFSKPEIFEILMTKASDLDLLPQNILQINPIKLAIDMGKFEMAKRMLEKVAVEIDLEAGDGDRIEILKLLEEELKSKL